MEFVEHIGYFAVQTLVTPLIWWTLILAVALLAFWGLPAKRPRLRYYAAASVLLAFPAGIIISFASSGMITTVTAPETIRWIAAPEIVITEAADSPAGIRNPLLFYTGAAFLAALIFVAIALVRLAGAFIRVHLLRSYASRIRDIDLQRKLIRLQKQLHITRPVELLTHPVATSPASFGWKHPAILLPADYRQIDPDKLESVLVHELGHIRHADYLISVVTEIITALTAFHPAARLLRRFLYRYQEMHCDVFVLGFGACAPAEYARALVSFSEKPVAAGPHPVCSAIRSGSRLRERIRKMNQYPVTELQKAHQYHLLAPGMAAGIFIAASAITSSDLSPESVEHPNDLQMAGSATAEPELLTDIPELFAEMDIAPGAVEREQIQADVAVYPDGDLQNVSIRNSMGSEFEQAFADALHNAEWEPAVESDNPVPGVTTIAIEFAENQSDREAKPENGMQQIYEHLEYPESAQDSGVQGLALIELELNASGELLESRILRNPGHGTGEAAHEAVSGVNWQPAYENGIPVASTARIPIRFQLRE